HRTTALGTSRPGAGGEGTGRAGRRGSGSRTADRGGPGRRRPPLGHRPRAGTGGRGAGRRHPGEDRRGTLRRGAAAGAEAGPALTRSEGGMTAPLHEVHPSDPGRRLPDTQQGMRRRNLARVMHTVSAEGPLSRAAVASRIGLTRAAVSTLVDELIRAGLLEELGPERPGRVGRPGSALAVSGRGPAGIGAEIGVDHLTVCAVDLRGVVRARAERHGTNRGRTPQPVLDELSALVGQVVADAEREGLWPAGLAVAV